MNGILTSNTPPGQSKPESNGNKEVTLHFQNSEALPLNTV